MELLFLIYSCYHRTWQTFREPLTSFEAHLQPDLSGVTAHFCRTPSKVEGLRLCMHNLNFLVFLLLLHYLNSPRLYLVCHQPSFSSLQSPLRACSVSHAYLKSCSAAYWLHLTEHFQQLHHFWARVLNVLHSRHLFHFLRNKRAWSGNCLRPSCQSSLQCYRRPCFRYGATATPRSWSRRSPCATSRWLCCSLALLVPWVVGVSRPDQNRTTNCRCLRVWDRFRLPLVSCLGPRPRLRRHHQGYSCRPPSPDSTQEEYRQDGWLVWQGGQILSWCRLVFLLASTKDPFSFAGRCFRNRYLLDFPCRVR